MSRDKEAADVLPQQPVLFRAAQRKSKIVAFRVSEQGQTRRKQLPEAQAYCILITGPIGVPVGLPSMRPGTAGPQGARNIVRPREKKKMTLFRGGIRQLNET